MMRRNVVLGAVILGLFAWAPAAEADPVTTLSQATLLTEYGAPASPVLTITASPFSYGSGLSAVTGTVSSVVWANNLGTGPAPYLYSYFVENTSSTGSLFGIAFQFSGIQANLGATFWECPDCAPPAPPPGGYVPPTDAIFASASKQLTFTWGATLGPGQQSGWFGTFSSTPPGQITGQILTGGTEHQAPIVASPVPEPATLGLLGMGLLGLGARARRRRKQ